MRYERFMRPKQPSKGPARLLAVACDATFTTSDCGENVRNLTLARWASRLWSGDPFNKTLTQSQQGEEGKDFLPLISSLIDRKGTTWLVSDNSVRDIALLGIWELIDRRLFYLSGDPVDEQGRKVCERDDSPQPTAILGNPPTIVSIRRPGSQGVLKILDVGNWGIESPDQELSAWERSAWIEQQIREMQFALAGRKWGGLRLTASSQADSIWRENYLTHCPFIHTNEQALLLEEDGVFGGRGQCFEIGRVQGPLYQLDVSGMYSFLGARLPLPLALHTHYAYGEGAPFKALDSCLGLLACVTIETDEPIYPVHWYHETVFPVGRFTTVLGGEELRHAMDSGHIVSVGEANSYVLQPFLAGVMQGLRAAKELYERLEKWQCAKVCKRWANSLIGRMARRDAQWVGYPWLEAPFPWGEYQRPCEDGELRTVRVLGWHPEIEEDCGFAEDAIPAAFIWITSAGRMMLWRLLQTAGIDNAYYCYTDELWVNEEGYSRLASAGECVPGEWGKLQIKGIHEWAVFDGINTYRTPNGVVCAGIPKQRGNAILPRTARARNASACVFMGNPGWSKACDCTSKSRKRWGESDNGQPVPWQRRAITWLYGDG